VNTIQVGIKVSVGSELLSDLEARGLVAQMTSEDSLRDFLDEPRILYCGFDPTADSLHIGSLVPLLTLKRFQMAGHKPVALVGGATGLIGDPSFKAQERKLNAPDIVAGWVEKLKSQVSRFIDFEAESNAAVVVNNLDWMSGVSVLDFLRDIGKYFSINNMISKESVKQRINREGAGISYTEFSYMLLQSYDFAELYKQHGCTIQIGGSDQWGNIVGGVELTRRLHGAQVYGLTLPLVTKADGAKFGKTESGTIWLDPLKTSPYAFYQFWLNAADADVYQFLKYFTFLDALKIDDIEKEDHAAAGRPSAQGILAEEVTRIVHGQMALSSAQKITETLFSGDVQDLTLSDLLQLEQDGLPSTILDQGKLSEEPLTSLFVLAGLAKNGKQVKDALSRNAIASNGEPLGWDQNMSAASLFTEQRSLHGKWFLVKFGKKSYHLFTLKKIDAANVML
jgi:tyrosyl-tRNA synthetase